MATVKMPPILFEDLPTEIFLEVFKYLRLREIVKAFCGLNSHIDSIVQHVINASHVVRPNDIDACKLLQNFSRQIGHLVVVNNDMADLTPLINLRSLTLKYGTTTQFDSIHPQYFPRLEVLHIKGFHTNENDAKESMNKLFQVILSNGFPRLRICTAFSIGSLDFNETWTGSYNLRTLNVNLNGIENGERVRALCPQLRRLTTSDSEIDFGLTTMLSRSAHRRRFIESENLDRLERENKFILDSSPWRGFGNKMPPSRFNSTTNQTSVKTNVTTLFGRILPQSEPYCRASFLVKITVPPEYPFKASEVRFLDSIYHPTVNEEGCYRCCMKHMLGDELWEPTKMLANIIEAAIDVIDNIPENLVHAYHPDVAPEYQENRAEFDRKALISTLSFGRPRD